MGLPSRAFNRIPIWRNHNAFPLIGSLALIYVFYDKLDHNSLLAFILYSTFMLFYLTVLWVPKINWNVTKYSIATGALCLLASYCHYAIHLNTAPLLWPLVAFLARLPQAKTVQSGILAAVCICDVVILSFTATFPWGELLGITGMYAVIRGSQLQGQAKRLAELHLKELNAAHQALRRAHAELEEASVQSVRFAALAERSRIARDVHDVIGHNLTTLIVQLQALRHVLPTDVQTAADLLPGMLEVARTGMDEVRHAVREWEQDDTGLGIIALRGLASQVESQTALRIEFMANEDMREWPFDVSIVLYRALQECFTNILRYAKAHAVRVHVREKDNHVCLTVADDGCYTGDPLLQPGFGMKGMLERCTSVGGTCTFTVNPPHGLTVNVQVPLQMVQETF